MKDEANEVNETVEEVVAFDVQKAPLKDLIAFHNAHCDEDKVVKKFKNRKAGIMAVADLIAEKGLDGEPAVAPPEGEEKPEAAPAGSDGHREAVRKTWDDPEVRRKRGIRRACEVDGVYYSSVRNAFVALDLPLKDHIPFRARVRNELTVVEYEMTWVDCDFIKATPKPKKPKPEAADAETPEAEAPAEA